MVFSQLCIFRLFIHLFPILFLPSSQLSMMMTRLSLKTFSPLIQFKWTPLFVPSLIPKTLSLVNPWNTILFFLKITLLFPSFSISFKNVVSFLPVFLKSVCSWRSCYYHHFFNLGKSTIALFPKNAKALLTSLIISLTSSGSLWTILPSRLLYHNDNITHLYL